MSIAAPVTASLRTTTPAATRTTVSSTVAAPKLRITARGRRVLAALVAVPVITVLAVVALLSGGSAIATGAGSAADFEYVTVAGGQSLWGIAESLAPEADPRDVIAEIMSLNQLTSSSVQPGQRIAIPADLAD
ncbi:LysM peptidoglycan-binding domain-containing protein [Herbiconiux sp. A18JL235]|uniref:LysM peptidoglycan-binding domain-containing protein n=1 Tax=Herbiconiux sp. A18JL235 TaxID=3152363 RepID=A0AB39BDN0_9MICO